jgi:hypothetical protein
MELIQDLLRAIGHRAKLRREATFYLLIIYAQERGNQNRVNKLLNNSY